jgi:hypothetical protein
MKGLQTVEAPRYCLFSRDGVGVTLGCAVAQRRFSNAVNVKTRWAIVPAIFVSSVSEGEV